MCVCVELYMYIYKKYKRFQVLCNTTGDRSGLGMGLLAYLLEAEEGVSLLRPEGGLV